MLVLLWVCFDLDCFFVGLWAGFGGGVIVVGLLICGMLVALVDGVI